jgi:hypothetical protein
LDVFKKLEVKSGKMSLIEIYLKYRARLMRWGFSTITCPVAPKVVGIKKIIVFEKLRRLYVRVSSARVLAT